MIEAVPARLLPDEPTMPGVAPADGLGECVDAGGAVLKDEAEGVPFQIVDQPGKPPPLPPRHPARPTTSNATNIHLTEETRMISVPFGNGR